MQQGHGGDRHGLVKVNVDGSYDVWNNDFCGHGSRVESRTREEQHKHGGLIKVSCDLKLLSKNAPPARAITKLH